MTASNIAAAPRWVRPDEVPSWQANVIVPGLFMGGTADEDVTMIAAQRADFGDTKPYDAVVTLYAWAQPVGWEVEELRYGFGDGVMGHVDVDRLLRLAIWAWERWKSGDRVLIRCQAGLNRSGLVTALVLLLDGYEAAEAIQVIRDQRSPRALCNQAFVTWLHDEGPRLTGGFRQRGDD